MQGFWLLAFIVQWVLVLMLALLMTGVLRQLGKIEERLTLISPRLSTYDVGQAIDDFELPAVGGTRWRSAENIERAGGAVIMFVSSTCSACSSLLSQITELFDRGELSLKRNLVVIAEGGAGTASQLLEAYPVLGRGTVTLLSDDEAKVLRQFGVTAVPSVLAVDARGRVLDQTLNAHMKNWLYGTLEVAPPETQPSKGWISKITTAAQSGPY